MSIFFSFLTVFLVFSCGLEMNKQDDLSTHLNLSDSSIVISDSIFTVGIEGPAVGLNGDFFLVNLKEDGTIARKKLGSDSFEVFVKLPMGSIGNGIRFDNTGNMFIADYPNHNILRVEYGTRQVEVFAHDSTMNQPNDLAIMDNGILFTSDPNWGEKSGNIWKIDLLGEMVLLEDSMGTTNGIEVNPKNNILYVNESIQRKIWAYDLDEKGNVSKKRLFYEFTDYGMDGMRCDKKGNLYVARYGAGVVVVISPKGVVIRTVILNGDKPTNVAFGGIKGDIVYVTLQDKKWVESFKANYPGRNF